MEKKSVSSRDLNAPYLRSPRQPAHGTPSSSGATEGHQTIPPAQQPAHGTEPTPSVTANASNLAAVVNPQPSKARESNCFFSAELRAATSKGAFDIDRFLSDEPSIATSAELGGGAARKNALPNLADLSAQTDQMPAKKKKKLKLPKLSFAKTSSAPQESAETSKSRSKFKFKFGLNFDGSNSSPKRQTHGPEGETPRSSAHQGEQTWHSPRPLNLIETVQDRSYALTKRAPEKTFMASVGQEDITGSLPHSQELVDHHSSDPTLQSDSVSESELNDLLAAMQAGDVAQPVPDMAEKFNQ